MAFLVVLTRSGDQHLEMVQSRIRQMRPTTFSTVGDRVVSPVSVVAQICRTAVKSKGDRGLAYETKRRGDEGATKVTFQSVGTEGRKLCRPIPRTLGREASVCGDVRNSCFSRHSGSVSVGLEARKLENVIAPSQFWHGGCIRTIGKEGNMVRGTSPFTIHNAPFEKPSFEEFESCERLRSTEKAVSASRRRPRTLWPRWVKWARR